MCCLQSDFEASPQKAYGLKAWKLIKKESQTYKKNFWRVFYITSLTTNQRISICVVNKKQSHFYASSWSGKTRTVFHAQLMELLVRSFMGHVRNSIYSQQKMRSKIWTEKNRSCYGGNRTKIQQNDHIQKSRMHATIMPRALA